MICLLIGHKYYAREGNTINCSVVLEEQPSESATTVFLCLRCGCPETIYASSGGEPQSQRATWTGLPKSRGG